MSSILSRTAAHNGTGRSASNALLDAAVEPGAEHGAGPKKEGGVHVVSV